MTFKKAYQASYEIIEDEIYMNIFTETSILRNYMGYLRYAPTGEPIVILENGGMSVAGLHALAEAVVEYINEKKDNNERTSR